MVGCCEYRQAPYSGEICRVPWCLTLGSVCRFCVLLGSLVLRTFARVANTYDAIAQAAAMLKFLRI
jgi:hypothetical protein